MSISVTETKARIPLFAITLYSVLPLTCYVIKFILAFDVLFEKASRFTF